MLALRHFYSFSYLSMISGTASQDIRHMDILYWEACGPGVQILLPPYNVLYIESVGAYMVCFFCSDANFTPIQVRNKGLEAEVV